MYSLALEKFSGPLDMLLNLVEDQKLSINEISLASVAEQYITYLKSIEEISKEELSAFLVIAATLILIKSRSLMPHMELTEEEDVDIRELERRLKTYKFFKELALKLSTLQKEHDHLFGREAYLGINALFIPPEHIDVQSLAKIIQELLATIPTKETLPTDTMGRTVSIEEKIMELKDRMEKVFSMSFEEMRQGTKEKLDVIVSFLAILELMKDGFLVLEQERTFDTINISKTLESQN